MPSLVVELVVLLLVVLSVPNLLNPEAMTRYRVSADGAVSDDRVLTERQKRAHQFVSLLIFVAGGLALLSWWGF
ncbi:hypothetical protein [Halorussus halophilus]|uniref:hypothetical protein n=1 Tax=Halorussus halophilus TaxID=2650975 RepID=UPI0013010EA7|nr:hypothetical protein [Halorussus halophilus]